MTIIVDASVAVKWVCEERASDQAAGLLRRDDLAAPALWLAEAANALWRKAESGELSPAQAEDRVAELANAPVAVLPIEADLLQAIAIAIELHHPVYDCLYLAAAVREGGSVVTADARFSRVAGSHPSFAGRVRTLEESG
jgi:predicted nucleic acid-binding protein